MLDPEEFTQKWRQFGNLGGNNEGLEHQVYAEAGVFYKRTDAFLHGNWLEYLYRIALHNALFPETQLEFRGLTDVPQGQGLGGSGGLYAVVSQMAIRAVRGATRAEVEAEMKKRGFARCSGEDYYNPETGVVVQDLHDENVVITPKGSLVIFDPIPVMAKAADFAKGGMLHGQPRPSSPLDGAWL